MHSDGLRRAVQSSFWDQVGIEQNDLDLDASPPLHKHKMHEDSKLTKRESAMKRSDLLSDLSDKPR